MNFVPPDGEKMDFYCIQDLQYPLYCKTVVIKKIKCTIENLVDMCSWMKGV